MRFALLLVVLLCTAVVSYSDVPEARSAEVTVSDTTWSWPDQPANLQVLPPTIGAAGLRGAMLSFTRSLGVRCVECHEGEEGADFLTWDFAADTKPSKEIAREMMRMTWALNQESLPAIWEETGHVPTEAEGLRVTCWTCHRGEKVPEQQAPPRER